MLNRDNSNAPAVTESSLLTLMHYMTNLRRDC